MRNCFQSDFGAVPKSVAIPMRFTLWDATFNRDGTRMFHGKVENKDHLQLIA
jgi:hypothetical protein